MKMNEVECLPAGKVEFTSLKLGCASLTSLLAAMLLDRWRQLLRPPQRPISASRQWIWIWTRKLHEIAGSWCHVGGDRKGCRFFGTQFVEHPSTLKFPWVCTKNRLQEGHRIHFQGKWILVFPRRSCHFMVEGFRIIPQRWGLVDSGKWHHHFIDSRFLDFLGIRSCTSDVLYIVLKIGGRCSLIG